MVDALIHSSRIDCRAMLFHRNGIWSFTIVLILFESGWVVGSRAGSGASLGHRIHFSLFLMLLISIQIVIVVS